MWLAIGFNVYYVGLVYTIHRAHSIQSVGRWLKMIRDESTVDRAVKSNTSQASELPSFAFHGFTLCGVYIPISSNSWRGTTSVSARQNLPDTFLGLKQNKVNQRVT